MAGLKERFRISRSRVLAILLVGMAGLAGVTLFLGTRVKSYTLRISAGDSLTHRHALAKILVQEAARRGLTLDLQTTSGSDEALQRVESGELDAALVQGGLTAGPHVRQVTALVPEALHLLIKPEFGTTGVEGLRGARLNLGPAGSGTRRMALELLQFVHLGPAAYRDESRTYAELREMSPAELPDAVFVVSALPSEMADWLVAERDYTLLPLPFGDALSVRDRTLQHAVIPAYAYRTLPPVPPEPLHTVSSRMLLVAHERVPSAAITELLEATFDGDFALRAELPQLDARELVLWQEFPAHPGTHVYLNRSQPLMTGEFIENLENLRSFLVSGLLALFLLWRWYNARRESGLEKYLDRIGRVEREAHDLSGRNALDAAALLRIHSQLSDLKSEILAKFASGKLHGESEMEGLIGHIIDVRALLQALAERPV